MNPRFRNTPVALTIAGSDSGGGAGIQADLKTFAAVGVFGTSAITCLTAQNPACVSGVAPAPRGFVARQIKAVCSAFPVAAAKTGMLFSAEIIAETARALRANRPPALVVDPVAKATSGSSLLEQEAEAALLSKLIPLATVITPNIPEAEMISGGTIITHADQLDAARDISVALKVSCILKGGHMRGKEMIDVMYHCGRMYKVISPRIKAKETHGTGCTLSAALTGYLAKGATLPAAFRKSCALVHAALANPYRTGKHYPLGIR